MRGRATEEGIARWFRRITPTRFDQADIHAEAQAFAAFLEGAVAGYGLDPARITALGYSNGANFAAALMGLHPGLLQRAILLRPMAALDDLPDADLGGVEVLSLSGERDPYGRFAPRLEQWLAARAADLTAEVLAAGHELTDADLARAGDWLARTGAAAA